MKKLLLFTVLSSLFLSVYAQEELVYQKPPKEILELADFERSPSLSIDSKHTQMIFQYRNTYKNLEELSEDEMRLAGLRINPSTNISSTVAYVNNLAYKTIKGKDAVRIAGLPENPKIAYLTWSPDETKVAFTNTTSTGVALWVVDLSTSQAVRLTEPVLNANLGSPFTWFNDSKSFLIRALPKNKPALINTEKTIATGPTVSVSEQGEKAQNPTYQDLLKNTADEANFETLITSELYKMDLDGKMTLWKEKDLYAGESFSPDGNYVLINTIRRPFSYIVPFSRFPAVTCIYDADGKLISKFDEKPLREVIPKGTMATYTGKRSISWRADQPATLYWVEALDEGDPEKQVEYRDEVFQLAAPFTGQAQSMVKTINRYAGIIWGNEQVAILYDNWFNTRNRKTYLFNPSASTGQKPEIISDRNSQDVYSDPGTFNTQRNGYGRNVLHMEGNKAFLIGDGFTETGQFPFIDEFDLKTKQTKRIYKSDYMDKQLDIMSIINIKTGECLVSLESPTAFPNCYIINVKRKTSPVAVTNFENPFKSLANVYKEVIKYKRNDGVELTGTLYLPAGYDRQKKEKLPMVMWAYPTEYKDKSSAGQNTTNPNEFIYPSYGSPVYWVTRGYAILDNAAFPVVGEGDEEPNDTFIEQLVANAKAAIDAVDEMGYIDRNRVAVGGHSYGAFMTANLLTHSDLFAAGIARSGAYNRSLTPFGFQREERNYWEAPNVYNAMSPFMHADKMKYPLLLIHGADDNNTGTYTMQSERYFNALKGFGAPARLVILPKESHGYAAKESVLHVLWEQDRWLDKYVKNKK